jgi:hypothetical protein
MGTRRARYHHTTAAVLRLLSGKPLNESRSLSLELKVLIDDCAQIRQIERFGEKTVCTNINRRCFRIVDRGKDNQRRSRLVQLAITSGEFSTIHDRHSRIEEDQVRLELRNHIERRFTLGRADHFEAIVFQRECDQLPDTRIVINDQYSAAC